MAETIPARRGSLLAAALVALVLVADLVAILVVNRGRFVYSLDDPYIHLALADNISRFNYGLQPGEAASPSSSILWPFLLAPFAPLRGFALVPLLFTSAATVGSTILLHALFARGVGRFIPDWALTVLTAASALTLNFVGVAFTGMEHSLQVFATLLTVLGVVRVLAGAAPRWWLFVGIVAVPLLRYESLAISLGAIGLVFLAGRRRQAVLLAVLVVGLMSAFSLWMVSRGLHALPDSVLIKGHIAGLTTTPLQAILKRFIHPVRSSLPLLAVTVALALQLGRDRPREDRLLAAYGVLCLLAHIAFGPFGGLPRYEVAVLTLGVALLGALLREPKGALGAKLTSTRGLVALLLCGAVIAPFLFRPYLESTALTARASHNIFSQQVQMHRFLTEYHRGPAAVNDIGLTSFHNPSYVLDLWGLSSDEVARHWLQDERGWMEPLVARRGIPLAIVYADWFDDVGIPGSWGLVAILHYRGKNASLGNKSAAFYTTGLTPSGPLIAQLRAFRPTLPADAELWIDGPDDDPAHPNPPRPTLRDTAPPER